MSYDSLGFRKKSLVKLAWYNIGFVPSFTIQICFSVVEVDEIIQLFGHHSHTVLPNKLSTWNLKKK